MSIAIMEPGQIIYIGEELYEISRKISEDEWQIEHLSTGRYETKTNDELLKLYSDGNLSFHVEPTSKAGHSLKQIENIDLLPPHLRDEAKARRAYVKAIENAGIQHFTENSMTPAIMEVHNKIKAPPTPPHWATVRRWCKRYQLGGQDIRSLVSRNNAKGNRNRRYDQSFLDLIQQAVKSTYLTREQKTIQDTLSESIELVRKENVLRLESMHLPLPTYALVKSEISVIPAHERDICRLGRQAAMIKYRRVKGSNTATKPLERAEIDHTILDLMVVDDETMLPLGRPTLTVCQDVKSRCALGIYIGFEPPSFLTVAQCLKQSIMPKTGLNEEFPSMQHTWDCHGVMETLVVDNGMEFHSANLEALCFPFGINIQYCPRKQPWFKPHIERYIGTLNRGIAHGNPGTTFSNIFEKGDYDAAKHATISLSSLKEAIYIWIVDVYHQSIHRSLMQQPIKVWRDNIDPMGVPLPTNLQDLECITGSIGTRKLTHKGVELERLFYNSQQMEDLRKLLGETTKVTIRYNEANIDHIYVIHPDTNEVIQVPSINPSYTKGLSLWQHKVCERFAKQHLKRKDIEAIAQAKALIQNIIAKDFHKKKIKTRSKAARFLTVVPTEHNDAPPGEPSNKSPALPKESNKQKYDRVEFQVDVSERSKWNPNDKDTRHEK